MMTKLPCGCVHVYAYNNVGDRINERWVRCKKHGGEGDTRKGRDDIEITEFGKLSKRKRRLAYGDNE